HPGEAFLRELLLDISSAHGVESLSLDAPLGVEITVREQDGIRYWFVLNHNAAPAEIDMGTANREPWFDLIGQRSLSDGRIALEGYGVAVLRQPDMM
ncbi:Beta-galactosidase C-terminal domain, partial [Paenibacillus sepulcri]|nr:Beta-galactosidase C-terminal domain [Paenibacillus sepulcri]